jgi:hypothetical protein
MTVLESLLVRQNVLQHSNCRENMGTMKIVTGESEAVYGRQLGTPAECERYRTEMAINKIARCDPGHKFTRP